MRIVLRDVESLSLTDDSTGEVGEVYWDPSVQSLSIDYLNQSQQPQTTVVPRGEDKILGQNVFGGVPVTIPAQTVVGAVYLPACVLGAASEAYLTVSDAVQADLSVQLIVPGGPTVIAEFVVQGPGQGGSNTDAVAINLFQSQITEGWYEVNAGLTSQTASGYVHGIRIVAEPID